MKDRESLMREKGQREEVDTYEAKNMEMSVDAWNRHDNHYWISGVPRKTHNRSGVKNRNGDRCGDDR